MHSASEFRGASRPASATPMHHDGDGEASGLIDVRKLAATPRPPSEPRLDLLLPRTAPPTAPQPLPRRAARPTQAPLYALMGLLTFGVVGLAAASLRGPTPAPARIVVVTEAPRTSLPDPPSAAPAEPSAPTPELTPEPAPTPPKEPSPTPRSSRPRDAPRKPDPARPASAPTPAPTPAPASDAPRGDEVRCLLEPDLCRKRAPAPAAPAEPAADASALPETLSLTDISEGIRPAKAAASSGCAALARGGEVVRVKISIAGPRGVVIGAAPEDDAGNPELARCCADALSEATFRPVQKAQLGAAATLKF